MTPLLEVTDLRVEFGTRDGVAHVLNGVDLAVGPGETLAVLGESGSGKSVTAAAVMGILDPAARVTGGSVRYRGEELLTAPPRRRRELRGEHIAMIFQDAPAALNPVHTVGFQIAEQLRTRRGADRRTARRRAVELLDLVGIPGAASRVDDHPHLFSGGMRQRAMIAMALALDPDVLIADEPTTALDVTVQAQIMDLLADLRAERGMALVLITHDLGVVAGAADRAAVMYAGRIVEHADVASLFAAPGHPYTTALLASQPQVGRELVPIRGLPPRLTAMPPGCPFHPRCPLARERCRIAMPPAVPLGTGRTSACHFTEELVP